MHIIRHTLRMLGLAAAALLAGCGTDPIDINTYAPVIDIYQYDTDQYNADLGQCRELGIRAQAIYEERRQREEDAAFTSAVVGGLIGAAIGNRLDDYDDSGTTIGAIYGTLIGAEVGSEGIDHDREFARFGPTAIVDRCMADRGYSILSRGGFGGG